MSAVPIFNRNGEPIQSVRDWEIRASPGEKRWADDRSANALAEAWIDGRGEDALLRLLRSAGPGAFDRVRLERAVAEAQTRFDSFSGPRNHDLLLSARDEHGSFPIGIEAKVNERFGQSVRAYRKVANQRRAAGESTDAPERLHGLLSALAGTSLEETQELGKLRYQLFAAVAGTLAATDETGSRAAFVVHELRTPAADPEAQAVNAQDLASYVELVFGLDRPSGDEWLVGPVRARRPYAKVRADIDLWIGHCVTP